jgi:hypothetical protein
MSRSLIDTLYRAIKYTVDIPIAADGSFNATRCNCSFCQKFGTTSLSPPSPDDFKLVQPTSLDQISGDYTKDSKTNHRYFCSHCAVYILQMGLIENDEGQKQEFFLFNVASIDQPQEGVDLNKVKIHYWDGLHYNWAGGMSEKPWPNGLP